MGLLTFEEERLLERRPDETLPVSEATGLLNVSALVASGGSVVTKELVMGMFWSVLEDRKRGLVLDMRIGSCLSEPIEILEGSVFILLDEKR